MTKAQNMTKAQLLDILETVAAQHGMTVDAFVAWMQNTE